MTDEGGGVEDSARVMARQMKLKNVVQVGVLRSS